MKKVFLLMGMFVFITAALFASEPVSTHEPVKGKAAKAAKITPAVTKKSGQCLAIFDLPCAYVFKFMDCTDMECISDYGWEQKWNGYNTQFCSPIQSLGSPLSFS